MAKALCLADEYTMPISPIMALGAGICSALAVFSIVFGSVAALPLFYLAPLPLYLAGLGIGSKGVLLASAAAIGTAALIGGVYAALPFAVAYVMPSFVACRQALRTFPGRNGQAAWTGPGDVAGTFTVMGAVGLMFAAFTVMMDSNVGPLADAVSGFLTTALDKMGGGRMPVESLDALVVGLAPYFPGMAVSSWVLMHIFNAIGAQAALVKSGRNIRPSVSYSDLSVPDWCSWLLVGAGVVTLVGSDDWSYLGRNMVIVALVPFFLVGLAVVHTFAKRIAGGMGLLVVFYILLLVLVWAAFVVAGAGVVEQWVGLRKRMGPPLNEESE